MTEKPQRFQLDLDALDKGSVIPAEVVEELTGVRRDSDRYSRRHVELCKWIRDQLKTRGKRVTTACVGKEIHVLTDEDASPYNVREFKKGLGRARRAHQRLLEVDTANLSDERRREHLREIEVRAAMLAGADMARRKALRACREPAPN